MITKEEVQHIAKLARLGLSESEIKKYQAQLGDILNYVDQLQKVDTGDIATSDGGTRDLENVWRTDENIEMDFNDNLINMSPNNLGGQVKVKKVL